MSSSGPPQIRTDALNEAIIALARAGYDVSPASPIFGGLWHVDRRQHLTNAQLIALAREVADKAKR